MYTCFRVLAAAREVHTFGKGGSGQLGHGDVECAWAPRVLGVRRVFRTLGTRREHQFLFGINAASRFRS